MTKKDESRTIGLSKEEAYFRRREMETIEMLRKEEAKKAKRAAMGEIVGSQDPKILVKLEAMGFNHETVSLLYLLPLVQTAWADNRVDPREMVLILDLSRERGITSGSLSDQVLAEWLRKRPANELFRDGLELISEILCSRPAEVRKKKALEIVELCARVAAASGGLFGFGERTSDEEGTVINNYANALQCRREAPDHDPESDDGLHQSDHFRKKVNGRR